MSALLDPCADPRWLRFVQTAPGATIFHHPAWLELIGARYGYPVAACCVLDAAGSICAGVPVALVSSSLTGRRLVAFPFSDACPPLGAPSHLVALGAALDGLRGTMGMPMEVRGPVAGAPAAREGARYHRHVVPLAGDIGDVERRFRGSNTLWGVRRARREGLVARRRTDGEALDGFFRLHLATRSRLGAPTQPLGYIRDLQGLFAREMGFVLLVGRGGDVAAAAVFLHHAGVLTYKYSASDVRARRMQPNNLLLWEAIRWGCENGMAQLDMGRTELGQEGLRSFKRGWGAEEEVLAYTCLGAARVRTADHGRLGRALEAGLRRSPPAASRVVGELLYRHVG